MVVDGQTSLNISNTSFLGCISTSDGSVVTGSGGVSVSITDSAFSDLIAYGSGGALSLSSSELHISRSDFRNCSAAANGYGGAVYVSESRSDIADTVFRNCTSSQGGGALVVSAGACALQKITITGCASQGDGGGIMVYEGAKVNMSGSKLAGLVSGGYGGAVTVVGGRLRISMSSFSSCSALSGGGAIFASQSQCYGAAALEATELVLEASQVVQCTSDGSGGALLITSGRVSALISSTLFRACMSKLAGGALAVAHGATVSLHGSSFVNNTSLDFGGGVSVISASNVLLQTSAFERCTAKISGGSISAQFSAVWTRDVKFYDCVAQQAGGGAVYSKFASLHMQNSTFERNSAPHGGGGALFWEGIDAPVIEPANTPCADNHAAFGSCLASACRYLSVTGMPSSLEPAYPGLEFSVSVTKKDAYHQTIITDSGTVLLTQAALGGNKGVIDPFLYISGKQIVKLFKGSAEFSLILKPTYFNVQWSPGNNSGTAVLASRPFVFFFGSDVETSLTVESDAVPVVLDSTDHVCPVGYVLTLDSSASSNLSAGICIVCVPGKYSVAPLAGISPGKPSCFNCPAGGSCAGGNKVTFELGLWEVAGGLYKLISCPAGFQLINLIGGRFSHDIQQCLECGQNQYILSPNSSAYSCQDCPPGARCDGSSLYGLVQGSTWIADATRGQYILSSCPPGYELLVAAQECGFCPAGRYCVGGSALSAPCPDSYYAPAGANASSSCLKVVFVTAMIAMPLTRERFLAVVTLYKEAVAAAAKISSSNIWIQSISRRAANASSGSSVLVNTQLAASDLNEAEGCKARLKSADLSLQLTARGLPSGDLRSVERTSLPATVGTSDFPISATIGICIGAFVGFTMCSVGAYMLTRKLRKQAEHRAFLHAFTNAQAGMAATPHHLPLKLRETYVAEEVLGKGAFGCVLKVKTKQGGKKMAIKIVVPERGGFNEREMRQHAREAIVLDLMTQHNCEHGVHLAGHGSVIMRQDICWFITELLEGQNLEAVFKDPAQGPFKDKECIKVARNVLAALKLMHSEGLIHRDIKPSNLMCTRRRRAGIHQPEDTNLNILHHYTLIDFGTAIGVDEQVAKEAMMTLSKEPVGAGTPPYMSPEMFKCPDEAKFPTDLWSLGVTLFELGTGILPFQAESSFMWSIVIAGNLDEKAPNILDRLDEERRSQFDHNLAKVIAKALEKRVEKRYSSVDEMHEAIYSCLIRRGEAEYSVFISYRVSSEAPLARILFDALNHTVTPGGHRVTVYWDAFRLVKGEGWEEGFATGLLNSICMFPILSHGSTAPLAQLPDGRVREGWDQMPGGRSRLQGRDTDQEDNFLKELLIGGFLLDRTNAEDRAGDECGMLEVIYPILVGRQEPKGHPNYPRMGDFFQVQGGGGSYPTEPSPPTNRAAARFLHERCGAPSAAVGAVEKRSVAQAVQLITSLQGCQLWNHSKEVQEAALSKEQVDLIGKGSVGPAVNIGGYALTAEQQALCRGGFDERQLCMLKAEVCFCYVS
jgi:serine/threonine protein kinase